MLQSKKTVTLYRVHDNRGRGPCFSRDPNINCVNFYEHFKPPPFSSLRRWNSNKYRHAFETLEEVYKNLYLPKPVVVSVLQVPEEDCEFVPDVVDESAGHKQVLFRPKRAKIISKIITHPKI